MTYFILNMDATILNIGDELLEGDTINTNATWLASQLTSMGVDIKRILVVPDSMNDIKNELKKEKERRDLILITGGLGPTHDDITVEAVANAFDLDVTRDEEILEKLYREYEKDDLLENTAEIPEGAEPVENKVGVDPGFIIYDDSVDVYVFPGVPEEMKGVFKEVENEFEGEKQNVEWLEVEGYESRLVSVFDKINKGFDVSIGSYPEKGLVKVKIKGDEAKKAKKALLREIEEKEN